jgi:diacylglycerol kinase (ATP)
VNEEAVFLVNPASANGSTARRWPALRRRAAELGLHGDELLSEGPGQLTELARGVAGDGRLVVVVGGDGTVNEVVNGLARTGAELAVLPNGTGQDFGRSHGIPTSFEGAVGVALRGTTRTVDLGRALFRGPDGVETARFFANVGSIGMSGAVAKRADSMSKALGGRVTFYYALVREFLSWRNTEVTVGLDDGERRGRMHDVILANGRWHGGGMKLAPDARPDDGFFDVVLIGDINKLDFVTTSPRLYSGRYVHHPKVEVVRSARVTVDAPAALPIELDGEQSGTTPARFEIVRGALRVRSGDRPVG